MYQTEEFYTFSIAVPTLDSFNGTDIEIATKHKSKNKQTQIYITYL